MTTAPTPSPLSDKERRDIITAPNDVPALRARVNGEAPKTFGEHAHRFIQHIVINHGVNLAISFWFGYVAKFGSDNWLGKGVHNLDAKANRLTDKYPSLSIPKSIFWLSSGGTVLMPVVRGMDEKSVKLPMVKFFDRLRDSVRSKKPDAYELEDRELAYARIAQEEHPGWGRTFVARLSGILFNMGTEVVLQKAHRAMIEVPGADAKDDYGYGWVGKKVVEDFEKAGRPLNEKQIWWAQSVPLEVLSTVNAVAFYNVVYRMFQRDGAEKHKAEARREEATPLAPLSSDNVAGEADRQAAARLVPQRRPKTEARAASYAEQAHLERAEMAERSV